MKKAIFIALAVVLCAGTLLFVMKDDEVSPRRGAELESSRATSPSIAAPDRDTRVSAR